MAFVSKDSYRFDEFELNPSERTFSRNGKPVLVSPKAFEVLACLLTNPRRVVTKDELLKAVWPDSFVEESNLTQHISMLRKALGDKSNYIVTVPGRGYQFTAKVRREPSLEALPERTSGSILLQRVRERTHMVIEESSSTPAGVLQHEARSSPGTSLDITPDQGVAPKPWGWKMFAAISALAGALAAGVFGWEVLAHPAAPRVLHVIQLTHIGLVGGVLTDGTRLYIGEQRGAVSSIAQVPLEGGDPVAIPTPFRNARLLDVLPSRSQLLVASFESLRDPKPLWILPMAGGSPRRLGELTAESARWSPDGTQIAFEGLDGALYLASSDASHVRKLTDLGGGVDSWSPDGRLIRFTRTNPAKGGRTIWEVQPDGINLKPFLPERQNPGARWGEGLSEGVWTPDGKYYFFRETYYPRVGIWAMPEKSGFWPFHRPEPTEVYAPAFEIGSFAMDPAGRRIFLVGGSVTQELVRYDRGLRQFIPFLPTLRGAPAWSPDQKWIGYIDADASLWKARPDGTDRLQLTFPPLQAFNLAWSPDGKRIAFHGLSPGQPGKIHIVSAEGGTIETLFAGEATAENCPFWSRDGNAILFDRTWLDKNGNPMRSALFTWVMNAHRLTELPGSQDMACPSWSPDEHYVAAHADDNRALSLLDSRSQRWRVIARGRFLNGPAWTHDGKWMFFQDSFEGKDQPIYHVSVPAGKVEEVASRKQLLRADIIRYRFFGLDPQDNPLAIVVHGDADIYALDLSLK